MCELLRRDRVRGPPLSSLSEHGGVVEMVVAEVSVGTRQTGVVLEHVVHIELVEGEEGGVELWVGDDGLVPHDAGKGAIEVQAIFKSFDGIIPGDVTTVTGEVAVVGECVEHRAGAAD